MSTVLLLALLVVLLVWQVLRLGLTLLERPRPPRATSPSWPPPAPRPPSGPPGEDASSLPPALLPYVVPRQGRAVPPAAPLCGSLPPGRAPSPRRRVPARPPVGWDDVIAFGLALEAADDVLAELRPLPVVDPAPPPRPVADMTFGPSDAAP